MVVINIKEKLRQCDGHGHPRIIGQLNGKEMYLRKAKSDFVGHSHKEED